jgi:Putative manganese efflux pump
VRYPIVLAVALFGLMSFVMSVIGLKLGGKLGTAAGEHGEVVGAIVLIGISGAMAMGWLLPGRDRREVTPRPRPASRTLARSCRTPAIAHDGVTVTGKAPAAASGNATGITRSGFARVCVRLV